ncbi:MAG: type II secretion system protein GspG [Deltaproteobacteria bacterium]|nr:type II secretion system protein GspG [Deltaproteobacteria bacterium]
MLKLGKTIFKNQKGMSLFEVLIVLGIIAGATVAILSNVLTSGDKANTKLAETEIAKLVGYCKLYKSDEGEYPESLDDLVEAGFIEDVPLDPWKNEYTYTKEGRKIEICSDGIDEDTENDDICSGKKKKDRE